MPHNKENDRRYYQKNRVEILAKQKAKRELDAEHRERCRAAGRKWAAENREYSRRYRLKKLHGLTDQQLAAVEAKKAAGCAFCGRTTGRLCVDHCHTTGAVRGILCTCCNRSLGNLGDTPAAIRKVLQYLEGTS